MEPPNLTPPKTPSHLFGSKAAGIVCGIVAAFLWWGIAIAVASAQRRSPEPGILIVGIVFVVQLTIVGASVRGSAAFVTTQVVTALLLPIIAIGLFFGACLLGGMK